MKRLALLLVLLVSPALAEDLPYPLGSTSQEYAGLKFQLHIPEDYDPKIGHGLMVVLHGSGGTETGMAASMAPLTKDYFVVCAPKSRHERTWSDKDLGDIKKIVRHLEDILNIENLHALGFSNGGWFLHPLVFDEKFRFSSAAWMAAGFKGGKVPTYARKEMGCIAMAGAQDGNRDAAENTVNLLRGKVKSVECRIQPNLDHKFTRELMPYYFWWLKVMAGRFEPGDDMSFEWMDDLDAAKARVGEQKTGAMLWFYSEAKDNANVEAKRLQQEVYFDWLVRHFGSRVVPVKLRREKNEELFESFKFKATPAIAIVDKKFKKKKTLEGKAIKAGPLAKALRSVAKDKSFPKD